MANTQIVVKRDKAKFGVKLKGMMKVVAQRDRDRFEQAAIGVFLSGALSKCTEDSVLQSIYYCFRWGLCPDPALRQVAIVPFWNGRAGVSEAKPIIMYNGLIDLARNADSSLVVRTGVVFDNDEFIMEDGSARGLTIRRPHTT